MFRPIYLVSFLLGLLLASKATALTLNDFYQSALEKTAIVTDRKLSEEIAEERKDQAYAQVLPTLSAVSSNVWREQVDVGAFGEGHQHSGYISLSQSLFQGGAEYHALNIADRLPQIAHLERVQTEINLFTEVAEAFYAVLKLESEQRNLEEQADLLARRVATLVQRAKIGRNKQTDVLAARAQAARVTANMARLKSQIVVAKQNLKSLTGVEEIPDLVDTHSLEKLQIPGSWRTKLLDSPRVRAASLTLENAQKEIQVAKGAYYPSLDLGANYYLDRAGILRSSDWDVTLNARWTLFSGGYNTSQTRIESLEAMRLEAQFKDLKRNLTTQFQAVEQEFIMHKDAIEKLDNAVRLSRRNYQEHVREANQGLVSNLDVLRVLEDYLQIKSAYDQQIYDAKVSWVRLRGLAGVRP